MMICKQKEIRKLGNFQILLRNLRKHLLKFEKKTCLSFRGLSEIKHVKDVFFHH